jgi:hypothetical protein
MIEFVHVVVSHGRLVFEAGRLGPVSIAMGMIKTRSSIVKEVTESDEG